MEDECNGKIIEEFIGLRSKCIHLEPIKGAIECVTSRLSLKDFRKCLLENKTFY